MELIKIENKDGLGAVVSSRTVAEKLGKRHEDVVKKIKECLDITHEANRVQYKYTSRGRDYEGYEYLITKDGFMLLTMNYIGYNDFKRSYIKRFNEMEMELIKTSIPSTYGEALLEAGRLALENDALTLDNKLKETKLIAQKPKVEFYNEVVQEEKFVDMGAASKILGIKGLGRNKLFALLRDKGVLNKYNMPYQRYVGAGKLKIIPTTKINWLGDPINKTVVSMTFLDKLRKKIKGEMED